MRKKNKLQKAASGLQSVAVPEQGSYSNVASSATSMAAAGAQFGPWGAAAGAVVGVGMGLIQKGQQDRANKAATKRNNYLTANRSAGGDDESIDQKVQRFRKGAKRVSTKPIEVEGDEVIASKSGSKFKMKADFKGGPSHEEGGIPITAVKGDVIFPANKRTEVVTAFKNNDHSKLEDIRQDLPEDNNMSKAQGGNRGAKPRKPRGMSNDGLPTPMDALLDLGRGMKKEITSAIPAGRPKPKVVKKPLSARDQKILDMQKPSKKLTVAESKAYKAPALAPSTQPYKAGNTWQRLGASTNRTPNTQEAKANAALQDGSNYKPTPASFPGTGAPAKVPFKSDPDPYTYKMKGFVGEPGLLPQGNATPAKPVVTPAAPRNRSSGRSRSKAVAKPVIATKGLTPFKPGDSTDLELDSLVNKPIMSSASTVAPITATSTKTTTPTAPAGQTGTAASNKFATGAANATQFAGVANNLYQSLKKSDPIKESYLEPDKIAYSDRSESLRQQSTSAANIQASNARNVSGGSGANMRANQNAAALSNLGRQNSIDENEMGRRDAIQAQNVGIANQAKQVNLGRKDMYEGQMAADRAAKQAYMDQAASDIGQYAMAQKEEAYMRSRDDKAYAAQAAGLRSINTMTPNFETDADGNRSFKPNMRRAPGVYKKGTKSIKTSKYKMK